MSHYDWDTFVFLVTNRVTPNDPNNLYIHWINHQVSYHGLQKCILLPVFIHNIHLKNTDFVLLQETSKHYLIFIFLHLLLGNSCPISWLRPYLDISPTQNFLDPPLVAGKLLVLLGGNSIYNKNRKSYKIIYQSSVI